MRIVCPAKIVAGLALLAVQSVAWAEPIGLAVNSRGFLSEDQIHVLWRVDLSDGGVERIGQTGFLDMEGLALSPDGTLYGADDESKTLVTVSTATGFSSPVGGQASNMGLPLAQPMDFGMTFTCTGELLVSSDTEQTLFRASLDSGRLERIGAPGSLGVPITGIASWGDAVYGIGQGITGTDGEFEADAPNLYRIDPEAGTAELVGSLGNAVLPYANAGLAFDESGVLWALTDRRANGVPDIPSEILRIDLATGTATKSADAALVGFESLAISAPAGCDTRGGEIEPPEEIPANTRFGLALLAMLMLFLASQRMRLQPHRNR